MGVWDQIEQAGQGLLDSGNNLYTEAKKKVEAGGNSATQLTNLVTPVVDAVPVINLQTTANNVTTGLDHAANSVTDAAKKAGESISPAFHNASNFLTSNVQGVGDSIGSIGAGIESAARKEADNMGNLNLSSSIDKLGNTAGDWGVKADTGVRAASQRLSQGVNNWTADPMKEFHGVTREISSAALAGLTPVTAVTDAASRLTGGSGNPAKDLGVSQDVIDGSRASKSAAVDIAKATAGVVMAIPTGGTSLLMTADVGSKYSGGSGDSLRDAGANQNYDFAGRLVATAAGSAEPTSLVANASNGAMGTAMINPRATADEIAQGAAIGGVTGMAGNVAGDTATGSIVNAAAKGATGSGIAATAAGKSAQDVMKYSLYGAAAGGGAQAINVGLDVGTGQSLKDNGEVGNNNSMQHFVNNENAAQTSALHGAARTVDTSLNWQQPTAAIAGGAWSGGVMADANGEKFADGAKVGAASGAASYVFQRTAQALGGGDTAQAAAGIVGGVAGQVAATKQLMNDNKQPLPILSLPAYVPNALGTEKGINENFKVNYTGTKNLNMTNTVRR